MSRNLARSLGALVAGALFAVGLVVSGMTNPRKVLGFLDLLGGWDPSLGFVMVGAIGVYAMAYRLAKRLTGPVAAEEFHEPRTRAVLDARLVGGAALFGVGWGLAGYCPGPSVVALGRGNVGAGIFVLALLSGIALVRLAERRLRHRASLQAAE